MGTISPIFFRVTQNSESPRRRWEEIAPIESLVFLNNVLPATDPTLFNLWTKNIIFVMVLGYISSFLKDW